MRREARTFRRIKVATCSADSHYEAQLYFGEAMRKSWKFGGMLDSGYDLLELYTCPKCRSTLSLTGIGPVREE